jgi:predicted PurR-regulated permease PerM
MDGAAGKRAEDAAALDTKRRRGTDSSRRIVAWLLGDDAWAPPSSGLLRYLAAKAVRAVALGIVVTAIAQTLLSALGLVISRVPHARALTAVTLLLCIAQLGPLFVLGPATIWLYSSGSPGRGTVLLAFTIVTAVLDNFLRPVLIKRGADLPLLLVFAGVIGGLIGFGIVGLFAGPVVLAVSWKLVESWVDDVDRPPSGARSK